MSSWNRFKRDLRFTLFGGTQAEKRARILQIPPDSPVLIGPLAPGEHFRRERAKMRVDNGRGRAVRTLGTIGVGLFVLWLVGRPWAVEDLVRYAVVLGGLAVLALLLRIFGARWQDRWARSVAERLGSHYVRSDFGEARKWLDRHWSWYLPPNGLSHTEMQIVGSRDGLPFLLLHQLELDPQYETEGGQPDGDVILKRTLLFVSKPGPQKPPQPMESIEHWGLPEPASVVRTPAGLFVFWAGGITTSMADDTAFILAEVLDRAVSRLHAQVQAE